jgi:hypothetical protein
MMIKSIRAEHWPVTDGTIQTSKMSSHQSNDSHGSHTTYSADVTYAYQIGGTNFVGKKIAIGEMSSSSAYAQGILNRYPVGKKVSVHYSPTNLSEAVVETGVHGGAWICLAVGTVFILVGVMFLQISRAAVKAQSSNDLSSPSNKTMPDGSIAMNKPPILFGVIFILAGLFIPFGQPADGMPHWIGWVAGGIFVSTGIALLLARLEDKIHAKIFGWLAGLLLLSVFNWISFAPGERIGSSTNFLGVTHQNVSVKSLFAIFTIFFDLVLLLIVIGKLWKLRKK